MFDFLKKQLFNLKLFGVLGFIQRTIEVIRIEGVKGVRNRLLCRVDDYSHWYKEYGDISPKNLILMKQVQSEFKVKPLISIIMPVYNPNISWLMDAIESLLEQVYENWELCIADDKSTDPEVLKLLQELEAEYSQINVIYRQDNGHISAASNSALSLAKGEWIALVDQDDLLTKDALFWVIKEINDHPNCKLIYSDEDKVTEKGAFVNGYFKPNWNPDLFYSQNLFSHLGVYEHSLIKKIGGFREGLEGSQDYDLVLRCIENIDRKSIRHIPRILYHWRIHSESTAKHNSIKSYTVDASIKALNDHFERRQIRAKASFLGKIFRVKYKLPNLAPKVSIIIPTRDQYKVLKKCVESILKKTSYDEYEIIIVDNQSTESQLMSYLEKLSSFENIRVIKYLKEFNYSAINNRAVEEANGDILVLLNNDVEVINDDWLSELVSHACRDEIGAVGAKLYYPNGRIQHAGVICGMGGVAGHLHKNLKRRAEGYFGRLLTIQQFSAVTAACLCVKKSIYEEVGGFNEQLKVAFNDVDFCLKIDSLGYRNIWTPYAELYHHESVSRGPENTKSKRLRFKYECDYMLKTWKKTIKNDPAYNPNLSLESERLLLAWPPRVKTISEIVNEKGH